jgi:hypothetical protein
MMMRWEQISPYNAVHALELNGLRLSAAQLAGVTEAMLAEIQHYQVEFDQQLKSVNCYAKGPPIEVGELSDPLFDLESLSELMTNELSRSFPTERHCPLRLTLVSSASDRQYLIIGYQHAIGDAQSIMLLVSTILDRLRHRATQSLMPLGQTESFSEIFQPDAGASRTVTRVRKITSDLLLGLKCCRPKPQNIHNTKQIHRIQASGLEVAELKSAAAHYGATVQQFLMAASAEAMAEVLATSGTTTIGMQDLLAVTAMMDLRRYADSRWDRTFGQFVGLFVVRPSLADCASFANLVRVVQKHSEQNRRNQEVLWSVSGLAMMARVWDSLPQSVNRDLARKLFPLVCAVSNMYVQAPLKDDVANGVISNYFRGANLGVMAPLLLSNTTTGDTFNLCTVHKDAVYSEAEIRQFIECVTQRIKKSR